MRFDIACHPEMSQNSVIFSLKPQCLVLKLVKLQFQSSAFLQILYVINGWSPNKLLVIIEITLLAISLLASSSWLLYLLNSIAPVFYPISCFCSCFPFFFPFYSFIFDVHRRNKKKKTKSRNFSTSFHFAFFLPSSFVFRLFTRWFHNNIIPFHDFWHNLYWSVKKYIKNHHGV